MRPLVTGAVLAACLSALALLAAPPSLSQESDVEELRLRAAAAMAELRYRDALDALEGIEAAGRATFGDRDGILTCLQRLREAEEYDRRLAAYMESEGDLFLRARFGARLISRHEERNRRERLRLLRGLYSQVYSWMRSGADSAGRRVVLAGFALRYAGFLAGDGGYDNARRIVDLCREVVELDAGAEIGGRALLMIARQSELNADLHGLDADDVLRAFREVVERFPASAAACEARVQMGRLLEGRSGFPQALAEYRAAAEGWPEHELAARARGRIEEILRPRLEVFVPEVFRPGATPHLEVRYRNAGRIEFALHAVDALELLRRQGRLEAIESVEISESEAEASWSFDTADAGDHRWHSARVEVPHSASGLYIVAAGAPGVANRSLLLVSGLATVVKCTDRSVLVYCADAAGGEPLGGVDLLVASDYSHPGGRDSGGYRFHTFAEGSSGDDGLWTAEIPRGEGSGHVLALARRGRDFALSSGYLRYWYRASSGPRIYLYTDRPAYRPEQTVGYRAVVRSYREGVYSNRPGETVTVTIEDARGEQVARELKRTNEFGTVSGELTLGEDPPLGRWLVKAEFGGEETVSRFRVEEYRRPEYLVSVAAGRPQYRLGERVEATVSARYLFGEPVAGAEVGYRVLQGRSYAAPPPRPGPHGWLYEMRGGRHRGGRVVASGSGATDAEGNLPISFATAALPGDERDVRVYDFTVVAEVTDASRREITGRGGVKVASHEFGVRVRADRNVYKPGDRVEVEFDAARFDGSPVAARGRIVLYSARWNAGRREYDLDRVWAAAAAAGPDGRGGFRFDAGGEGYLLVRFEAPDQYDNLVVGAAGIWVSGEQAGARFFRSGSVEIVPDREHYRLGDTATLLIHSQFDGARGLLTVEGGGLLLARVLELRRGANAVELTITESYEPNVFVKLHVVRDFALHSDSLELLVPPEEKLATVTVTPSSSDGRFRPGGTGRFEVRALDWRGEPLQAEFSIGVVDSAIYYIAEDATPDIRSFFYGSPRRDVVDTSSSFEFRFHGAGEEMMARSAAPDAATSGGEFGEGGVGGGGLVEPDVRRDFRDSALWLAHARTGPDGTATVDVRWPDNLTTWRATVRAVTPETVVGQAVGEAVTRKNLLLRLQAPRFLVQGDRVTLALNVHNYLDSAKRVLVSLEAGGEGLELAGETERRLEIEPGGRARLDVAAVAVEPGEARLLARALSDEESDALELTLPVLVHGIEGFDAAAGLVERRRDIELSLPEAIRPGSARLRLSVRPTLAGAMLDSLPYLIDYPYGCTEQTMSRFLPAAMVAGALRELGLSRPGLEERLPGIVAASLARLYDFQHADGGWGWWRHDPSDAYMTAYVVYGLAEAGRIGIEVDAVRLRRAVVFLRRSLRDLADRAELLNFVVFALSFSESVPEQYLNRIFDLLPRLPAYETALFAVALHNMGHGERFAAVVALLEARADVDAGHGIASWGRPGGRYWYQDNVEATALALMALMRAEHRGGLAAGAARWLMSVRKGGRWKSTRDTAFAIYALTEYLRRSGELDPDMTVSVELDGRPLRTARFTRANLFGDDGLVELGPEELAPGTLRLRIAVEGRGNLYFDALLTYFSLEERLGAAATTIAVSRTYSRLIRGADAEGREVVDRVPLRDGEPLAGGEEIEVRLELASANNYEHLVFEDFKPAGCEPVALRSGRSHGRICSNIELRDEKVVFFIGYLPQGTSAITYTLRAEAPGLFHALPASGYAMYAPDLRARSDEFVLPIGDGGRERAEP